MQDNQSQTLSALFFPVPSSIVLPSNWPCHKYYCLTGLFSQVNENLCHSITADITSARVLGQKRQTISCYFKLLWFVVLQSKIQTRGISRLLFCGNNKKERTNKKQCIFLVQDPRVQHEWLDVPFGSLAEHTDHIAFLDYTNWSLAASADAAGLFSNNNQTFLPLLYFLNDVRYTKTTASLYVLRMYYYCIAIEHAFAIPSHASSICIFIYKRGKGRRWRGWKTRILLASR